MTTVEELIARYQEIEAQQEDLDLTERTGGMVMETQAQAVADARMELLDDFVKWAKAATGETKEPYWAHLGDDPCDSLSFTTNGPGPRFCDDHDRRVHLVRP